MYTCAWLCNKYKFHIRWNSHNNFFILLDLGLIHEITDHELKIMNTTNACARITYLCYYI